MRFYTNVQLIGNKFLVRGYDNGKHVQFRDDYNPTLFVPSKKESKYRTLEGERVEPIQPGFVRDCREFYKKYQDVEGFKIYGNDRYVSQYISDKYPEDEIKFDISKIRLVTLDIGDPNCKLIEPFILGENDTLSPWLIDVTNDNEFMMCSDKILTLVEAKPTLLEKYQNLIK